MSGTQRSVSVLVLVVAIAVALAYLDRHPVRLSPGNAPREDAVVPARGEGHGVLLVVGDDLSSPTRRKAGSGPRPSDLEWENLLRFRVGGCDVATVSDLVADPRGLVDGRSLLVLPHGVLTALPLSVLGPLEQAMTSSSLVVIAEAPEGEWAGALRLRVSSVESRTRLAWPLPPSLPGLEAPAMALPPPSVRLEHSALRHAPEPQSIRDRTIPAVSVAGRLEIWRRDVDGGAWIVLSPDLAALSTLLRQGRSPRDSDLASERDNVLRTGHLLASSDLASAGHPWLDAWTFALLDDDAMPAPWPRLDTAPPGADGWLVAVAVSASEPPTESGGALTLLLPAPDLPGASAEAPTVQEVPVFAPGLLTRWPSAVTWATAVAPRERFGLLGIEPVARLPSHLEQRHRLATLLPGGVGLPTNRNLEQVWDTDGDRVWGELAAAGTRIDLSYGPPSGEMGWAFGSALPFRPLAESGRRFPLWELPTLGVAASPGALTDRLDGWMRVNAFSSRGPLTLVVGDESGETLSTLHSLAVRGRHRPVSTEELVDWYEARDRTTVRWSFDGTTLTVEARVAGPEQTLTLPFLWRGRRLVRWEADWPAPGMERGSWFARPVRRFALPSQGGAILRAEYAPPSGPE